MGADVSPGPAGARRLLAAAVLVLIPAALWLGGIRPHGATIHVVDVIDFAFEPRTVEVASGDVVFWRVVSGTHSSTADDGSWDSGLVEVGGTFQRRFAAAGDFGYFCTPHDFMRGSIGVRPVGVLERWGFWAGTVVAALVALSVARPARRERSGPT